MSSLKIFQNLVGILAYFLKGWNIPGAPAKAIMSGSFLGGPKVYACKNWSSPTGGEIIDPPLGEIILRKVHPADNEGGGASS